jgi:hypothetical protein
MFCLLQVLSATARKDMQVEVVVVVLIWMLFGANDAGRADVESVLTNHH